MSTPTPGHWRVGSRLTDDTLPVLDAGPHCECVVAFVPPNTTDGNHTNHQVANANLIAAAPDLLHALEKIEANAAESVEWIRRVTSAAIAKAKGELPS